MVRRKPKIFSGMCRDKPNHPDRELLVVCKLLD